MSIVWTLIASFLYVEIAVVLLFVLPIFSAQRWQRFFRSRLMQMVQRQAQMYFYLLLGVLLLFLLDAIREMRKYSNIDHSSAAGDHRHDMGMQHSMRMFRAQRNFYISGFAIFLVLVIRRLVILISEQAAAAVETEAIKRQALSATSAARTLLSAQKQQEQAGGAGAGAVAGGRNDETDRTMEAQRTQALIAELRAKIDTLNAELVGERRDKLAIQSQANSLIAEYDRVTDEYSKLDRQLKAASSVKPGKVE